LELQQPICVPLDAVRRTPHESYQTLLLPFRTPLLPTNSYLKARATRFCSIPQVWPRSRASATSSRSAAVTLTSTWSPGSLSSETLSTGERREVRC